MRNSCQVQNSLISHLYIWERGTDLDPFLWNAQQHFSSVVSLSKVRHWPLQAGWWWRSAWGRRRSGCESIRCRRPGRSSGPESSGPAPPPSRHTGRPAAAGRSDTGGRGRCALPTGTWTLTCEELGATWCLQAQPVRQHTTVRIKPQCNLKFVQINLQTILINLMKTRVLSLFILLWKYKLYFQAVDGWSVKTRYLKMSYRHIRNFIWI